MVKLVDPRDTDGVTFASLDAGDVFVSRGGDIYMKGQNKTGYNSISMRSGRFALISDSAVVFPLPNAELHLNG